MILYIKEGIIALKCDATLEYEENLFLETQGNRNVKALVGIFYRSLL